MNSLITTFPRGGFFGHSLLASLFLMLVQTSGVRGQTYSSSATTGRVTFQDPTHAVLHGMVSATWKSASGSGPADGRGWFELEYAEVPGSSIPFNGSREITVVLPVQQHPNYMYWYPFRAAAKATGGGVTAYGTDEMLIIPPMETSPAQDIGPNSATLVARYAFNGFTANGQGKVRFEWGTTPNLGNVTPWVDSNNTGEFLWLDHTHQLTGLKWGTTYYYRLNVLNIDRPNDDPIPAFTQSFTTLSVATRDPGFDRIPDVTIPEDSRQQVVWITGVNDGEDPLDMPLTFTAQTDNPDLIRYVQTEYEQGSSQARLSFYPWPGRSGSAHITVILTNLGRSFTNTFTVTLTPVNHPPVAGYNSALTFPLQVGYMLNSATSLTAIPFQGGNTPHTIEGWIKPHSTVSIPGRATVLTLGSPVAHSHRWAVEYGGRVWMSLGQGLEFSAPISAGAWVHLAASYDGTNFVGYINGEPVNGAAGPVNLASTFLVLGGHDDNGPDYKGSLQEVRVWNYARQADEILNSWNHALSGNEPGLVLYWPLNEGFGQDTHDAKAGDQNDGVITLGNTWTEGVPNLMKWLVPQDGQATLRLPGFDHENPSLTYQIVNPPAHGSLSGAGPDMVYKPNPNYTGPDHFTYRVSDGQLWSENATVNLAVDAVNAAPTLSPIVDQLIEENSSNIVAFVVTDRETPLEDLNFQIRSDNTELVPAANVRISGTSANRQLIVVPDPDQTGIANLSISVTDTGIEGETGPGKGPLTTTISYRLKVIPPLVYAVTDLGALTGSQASYGFGLNNNEVVVGASGTTNQTQLQAFWRDRWFTDTASPSLISASWAINGRAYDINSLNVVAGAASLSSGYYHAFKYDLSSGAMTDLGAPPGATHTVGLAINQSGNVAGYYVLGGVTNAFFYVGGYTNIGILPGGSWAQAKSINDLNVVAGCGDMGGNLRAFFYASGNKQIIAPAGEYTGSMAAAINNSGLVAGSWVNTSGHAAPFLYDSRNQTVLVTLPAVASNTVNRLNNYGQMVGESGAGTAQRPWLFSHGRLLDLNSLLAEAHSGWTLLNAKAINDDGAITGTGLSNGQLRAYLAIPGRVIGHRMPRPMGTLARQPDVEILKGKSDDTALNAFRWAAPESKLFPIRPAISRLNWYVFPELTNSTRVQEVIVSVWPTNPVQHVAYSPVNVQPSVEAMRHAFMSLDYTTSPGASVDSTTRNFSTTAPGYSVLFYLRNEGRPLNPATDRTYLEVVRTFHWNDPRLLQDAVPWTIGGANPVVTYAKHQEYQGRNGFVFFTNAFYDPEAYDRNNRLGPILPVNKSIVGSGAPGASNQLVVVWYAYSPIGVPWANQPVRYSLDWPTSAPHLVIASGLGSGPLDTTIYREAQIYNQPDRAVAGFNPNEEHALMAPVESGTAVFAIRNDLNAVMNLSEPFVLLKYKDADAYLLDPNTREWRIKAYQVVAEEAPFFFSYAGVAGQLIEPPMPLKVLPICSESTGVTGPYFEDYKGRLYARAAGRHGTNALIVARWFYPLQPGFYYHFNGTADVPLNTSLALLDRRPGGSPGIPVDMRYNIRWPNDIPRLQLGQTVVRSTAGLPDIKNMAAVQTIYDDLNYQDGNSANTLARLYDPLTPRHVVLPSGYSFSDDIRRLSVSGKVAFLDLPYDLRMRLKYDPVNHWLSFEGYLDELTAGEPLLLPNVMTARERDRIKTLDGVSMVTVFDQTIDALYDLTRNPNLVDADGNGQPDRTLSIGLATQYIYISGGVTNDTFTHPANGATILSTNIVPEPLLGPKALTAGLRVAPAEPRPLNALKFDGTTASVECPLTGLDPVNGLTVEAWVFRSGRAPNQEGPILSKTTSTSFSNPGDWGIYFDSGSRLYFRTAAGQVDYQLPDGAELNSWNHLAAVYDPHANQFRLYVNGILRAQTTATRPLTVNTQPLWIGHSPSATWNGMVDEIRLWNRARNDYEIAHDRRLRLTGNEEGLYAYWTCDEGAGSATIDQSTNAWTATLNNAVSWVQATNLQAGIPPRFVTLIVNNEANLQLPVTLYVIQVDDGPFPGDLKVIYPDNALDERLTLRASGDFGCEPERMQFEWYYKPQSQGPDLPAVNAENGAILDLKGWILYPMTPADGVGVNYITLGDGGMSGIILLSDNWYICRYRGYQVGLKGTNVWSDWIGAPGGQGPQLAEGWIKRVIRGLNPFDARTTNFHASAAATFTSMLMEAGRRYEGDIALNPNSPDYQSVGLIEAYTTVLERGGKLSIDVTPPVDFPDANNALMMAANRVASLYTLLGNEANADALDPTIGFSTDDAQHGSLASSMFAFENQLSSPLEEELVLLRGRSYTPGEPIQAPPVYNRLYWNFTLGDGQAAYVQTYNITDQNRDGMMDAKDAMILYPQGHGDAWGHYLTALTTFYKLLRHPFFTWKPRTEFVMVAGAPIAVDYTDEQKFAEIASAKAKAGAQIVNLTYRANYVDDPGGQWQGYKDSDKDRAWGVSEWARRVGQGVFVDWIAANAILPAADPDSAHQGIQKIDRTTVGALSELADQLSLVQAELDRADAGMNPVGLVSGAVAFDIDPQQVGAGKTHFEQIYDRALGAINNALLAWNQANQMSASLRRSQDTAEQYQKNVIDQERDYKNRLIEIFGYPYENDKGPGATYPSDYDGPDIYHYQYVANTSLSGTVANPTNLLTGYFKPFKSGLSDFGFYFESDLPAWLSNTVPQDTILTVKYPMASQGYAMVAPASWGQRRAPGQLQQIISDWLQAETRFQQALRKYDNLLQQISDMADLIQARYDLRQDTLQLKREETAIVGTLAGVAAAAKLTQKVFAGKATAALRLGDIASDGCPKVVGLANDCTSALRASLRLTALAGAETAELVAGISGSVAEAALQSIDVTKAAYDTKIEDENYQFAQKQMLQQLQELVRQEGPARLELAALAENVRQQQSHYAATLAKGQELLEERIAYRQRTAADVSKARYQDMTFRIVRNDALQKYAAQFDLAARYVYLAATAYDYETSMISQDERAGRGFLTAIIRQRSLGQVLSGVPVPGSPGLADVLGRLGLNFKVLKSQLGFNNPQIEGNRFSLRQELFRIRAGEDSDSTWQAVLLKNRVPDLREVPEFRRYCRPTMEDSTKPQPALVLRFSTSVLGAKNFFGWPLGGGDSYYDSSQFATKIKAVGVWFHNYDAANLVRTPRIYLLPVGEDVLRSPIANDFRTRLWRVMDQTLPVPFPLNTTQIQQPGYIPINDSLSEMYAAFRLFPAILAHHDSGYVNPTELATNSRLIGRSVWNTEWMLIIPGSSLLGDQELGLDLFINTVKDIKLLFQTYSYSGN